MMTLIGSGGHAWDIMATLPNFRALWRHYPHHSEYEPADADKVIVAINDSGVRATVAAELGIEDVEWIHPNAFIGPSCATGPGTHINYGVTMTRTTIGHHTTIAPGVTICGDVTIGDRVFIGAGAVIVNLTTVPDDTFIKAGSVWSQR